MQNSRNYFPIYVGVAAITLGIPFAMTDQATFTLQDVNSHIMELFVQPLTEVPSFSAFMRFVSGHVLLPIGIAILLAELLLGLKQPIQNAACRYVTNRKAQAMLLFIANCMVSKHNSFTFMFHSYSALWTDQIKHYCVDHFSNQFTIE